MEKTKLHKRSISRIAAVQGIYQMLISDASQAEAVADFQNHFKKEILAALDSKKYDTKLFEELLEGVSNEMEALDELIKKSLPENWTCERLDRVLYAILRSGAFELWKYQDIDRAVIINEYVNVAHTFYDEKEPAFVNGVLHHISTIV